MKTTMKKKLVSTALAAIMSVTALAGTVMNANAAGKGIVFSYTVLESDEILFRRPYNNTSKYPNSIYVRTDYRPFLKNQMCTYTLIYLPKNVYGKLYFDGSNHYIKTSQKCDYFNYTLVLNSKRERVGNPISSSNTKTSDCIYCDDSIYHLLCGEQRGSNVFYTNGDVNNDGNVDILDARYIINHINGVRALSDTEEFYADVNEDDEIDIVDAQMIINHINGVKKLW